MCGLVGYISETLPKEWLDRLLNSMIHRGPDGDGAYHRGSLSIGMRRLSVIDLDGGWQPLFSRNGRIVVFQNGEIYNYLELQSQLDLRVTYFAPQATPRSSLTDMMHGHSKAFCNVWTACSRLRSTIRIATNSIWRQIGSVRNHYFIRPPLKALRSARAA